MSPVLVIGASLAGLTATDALRNGGYDGELVVVDPSPQLPPDRPPLSKQVLAGDWEPERAVHRSATRLPELGVDLRLGVAATALDAATRTVSLSDGSELQASGVVLAMGAAPRHLPDEPERGVHVLRTMEDCLALRAELDGGPERVAVIGAGFIGAEVAATCRARTPSSSAAPTPCAVPDMMQFPARSWKVWPAGRDGAIAGTPPVPAMPGTVVAGEDG